MVLSSNPGTLVPSYNTKETKVCSYYFRILRVIGQLRVQHPRYSRPSISWFWGESEKVV